MGVIVKITRLKSDGANEKHKIEKWFIADDYVDVLREFLNSVGVKKNKPIKFSNSNFTEEKD